MEMQDYDRTIPFYVCVNEDYQDWWPEGSIVSAIEVEDPEGQHDSPVWRLQDDVGHEEIVPRGSQADLFYRTGDVARPLGRVERAALKLQRRYPDKFGPKEPKLEHRLDPVAVIVEILADLD